jgi:hypothetical protein
MAYDLAEAVDLSVKYDGVWQDKILEMKKWNEKKEMLDALITDSNTLKIKNGDFSGLVKSLKKLLSDSNFVVMQLTIKACANLAKGLKEDFEGGTKELAGPLIMKFKEKKTQIIDDVHIALENFIECTNLEGLCSDLVEGIQDKAPTVKKNTCLFLEKIV